MQTITVDIIDEKAVKLLEDLETRQLIRLRKEKKESYDGEAFIKKYMGAMTPQPVEEIDRQLDELRNAWE